MSATIRPTALPTPGSGPRRGPVGNRDELALTAAVTIQVNIFVFGLIGLVILFRLPALVGLLRSGVGRPILQIFTRGPKPAEWKKKAKKALGDLEHPRIERIAFPSNAQLSGNAAMRIKCPPRVPAIPTFLGPLGRLLRSRRIISGYSTLQLGILMNYTYILLYGLLRLSNPFTDNTRSAWMSASQLPLIFALAQKSNVLGSLLVCELVKLYSPICWTLGYFGRKHTLSPVYQWTNAAIFREMISQPKNIWGLVLMVAMDVLCFFSTGYWRRRAYNVFYWTHTLSVAVLIVAACFHQPTMRPYMYACAACYGLDRIVRAFKSTIATATIAHLPQMDMAYIEIQTLRSGWRAGQHVRLRVFSMGMGLLGWTESHPFTIASASEGTDGLVLLCRRAGNWTGKLVDLAKKLDGEFEGNQGEVRIWVEGPFGGPSRMVFAGYSAVVLTVGGSGITFGLSIIEELLSMDRRHQSRVKYIELVWVVPEAASIKPLVQLFTSLMQQTDSTVLRISIHFTRTLTVSIVHPHLTLTPGRPKFKNVLNNAIDNALTGGPGKSNLDVSGVAVGICGPASLGDEVVRSVGEIDASTRFRVGGIEIHEETFGW